MELRDNDGRTCLHVAAEQGSVHACRLIFEMNEQLNNASYMYMMGIKTGRHHFI